MHIGGLVDHGRRTSLFPSPPLWSTQRNATAVSTGEFRSEWAYTPILAGVAATSLVPTPTSMSGQIVSISALDLSDLAPERGAASPFATTLFLDYEGLIRALVARPVPSKSGVSFTSLVEKIRAISGLNAKEFAGLFGRSRESYYLWLKRKPSAEIRARTQAIAEALAVVESQPAHRIRDWLYSGDQEPMKLLVAQDFHAFVDRARSWTGAAATPRTARRLTMDQVAAMAAAQPEEEDDRIQRFLAWAVEPAIPTVRLNQNFYQDLLSSVDDEDE